MEEGGDSSVYKIDLALPTNTSQDNEIRRYVTDHESLMRIPLPGYYDPDIGEAIVNIEVVPKRVTATEVVEAIGKDGAGGSFNRDISGGGIVRALPQLFPQDYCTIVKRLVPNWVDPTDYEEDDPEDADMIKILTSCGIECGIDDAKVYQMCIKDGRHLRDRDRDGNCLWCGHS